MSGQIGEIINERKSESGGDTPAANSDSKRASEPEIINGFSFEPDTERIGVPGIKLTKSGKPDRRTKAARGAGNASDAPTGEETGKVHLSKLDLGELLFSIHLTLSEFTQIPELEIDKSEAKELGDAARDFAKFYGVSFDPKKVALFNLCLAAGKVYVPRVIAIKRRLDSESGPKLVENHPAPKQRVNGATTQEVHLGGMSPSMLWQQDGAL
jgi:hypothetical protein